MADKEASKAINDKFVALGSAKGVLGSPTTGKLVADAGNTGYHVDYANGSIYWGVKAKRAYAVLGAILKKWLSLGGPKGTLGYPTSDEIVGGRIGRWNTFENNGAIVLTTPWGPEAHWVDGLIYDKYKEAGGPSESKHNNHYPLEDPKLTPDGKATVQHFSGRGGPHVIYITPRKQVVRITGHVVQKWNSLGGPDGVLNGGPKLGYPVSDSKSEDRADLPGQPVQFLEFVCDTGMRAVIYNTSHGACVIYGEILRKWQALGGPNYSLNGAANLGYPSTDEMGASGGGARYNQFTCGDAKNNTRAAIYWHPSAGTHLVYGPIYDHWTSLGGLGSVLGWPTSDVALCGDKGGMYCDFSGGSIYWSVKNGCFMHRGPLPDTLGPDALYRDPQTPDGGIWLDFTASCDTHVQLWRNGNVRWWGKFHADGRPSFAMWANTLVADADGAQYKFGVTGSVGGSLSTAAATASWDTKENRSGVALNWRALVAKADVWPSAGGSNTTLGELFKAGIGVAPTVIEIAGKVAPYIAG